MEQVRLGKTGLMVSRVGFGGIPVQRLQEAEGVALVKRCLDLNITFFDTANAYTSSEGFIGMAIAGRREGLVLATKSTSRNPERLERHLHTSLERLGVEIIDLYQLHGVDDLDTYRRVTGPGGVLDTLKRATDQGKIKHIGITSHSLDVSKLAVQSGHFETLQFPFNFVDKEAMDELIPLCRQNDVGFIAMKPMGGGRLENASLALKFLLQFPGIVPVVGVDAIWQVDEMVDIANGNLSLAEEEKRLMAEIVEGLDEEYCRHCSYCEPCPQGIIVGAALDFPTFVKRFPREFCFSGWVAENMEKASNCNECGECEDKCPFKLPIRALLKEYVALFQKLKTSAS